MTRNDAYPDDLRDIEAKLVGIRRDSVGYSDEKAPYIGLALSGGGVRSATFALGILQALAAKRCLDKIDFLSTVSGGGYIGAFLSRFFGRDGEDAGTVQRSLDPRSQHGGNPISKIGDVLAWLRENGRFLAPTGNGDLLTGGAMMLRNWVAVHVVLASLLLMLLLIPQLLGQWLYMKFPEQFECLTHWWSAPAATNPTWVWTPYVVLAPLILIGWIVPSGWAYWLSPPRGSEIATGAKMHATTFARMGFAFVAIVAALLAWFTNCRDTWVGWVAITVVAAAVLTVLFALSAKILSGSFDYFDESNREYVRRALSDWLKYGLVAFAACFVFVLIDSIGRTAYDEAINHNLAAWIGSIFAGLAMLAAGARRIVVAVAPVGTMQRTSAMLVKAIGIAGAFLLYLILLSVLDVIAHGLALGFGTSGPAPTAASLFVPLCAFGFLVVLNLFIGRTWTFINDSTIQPLYRARLARAYLGATNPVRVPLGGTDFKRVTQVAPDDDIPIDKLWWNETRSGAAGAFERGAPLHLINVTINETLDGRTGIQNNDRRGIGMALGPAGISAGIRHHIVIRPKGWACYPQQGFRMFDYAPANLQNDAPPFEQLTLAQWIGLSGAAFSTGLGARTSLGLSLLAGFFNVRLGYWWNSGVDPGVRDASGPPKSLPGRLFTSLFPLQSYLFDEFVARFHGTGRRWWYISDGGHFENMGAYELLRRRVPLIFIVDAEADSDYRFEGLSNLVRKARLDFNAEIRFVDDVAARLGRLGLPRYFGPLEKLRPGSQPAANADDGSLSSACHAALAMVCYDGATTPSSWIIYVKPSLSGDEPADISQYRSENPEFPQQPTSDQFFDEAQWESYRRLGEHIGGKIFSEGLSPYVRLTSHT